MEKVILQKLANKYNLPINKIKQAVFYQFKYVGNIMKEGKFEPVRLPYLGKFHVLPGRLKHLQKRNERSTDSK